MDANQLRRAWTQFFSERDHTPVPSSGLIPHHPRAPLFTNAGMNQFLPYFLGEEAAPYARACSIQKCVRVKGKHDDIDLIGRTTRHLTYFEMLGNFSFGDYFKEGAIPFAWEFLTETLGLDGDRLWITVHDSDDEAADIWRDTVGVPAERIQRMGEDNFWEMGDTGPCGPCSEIYYDKGGAFGPPGGPAGGGGEERYVEIWNLVFMQYDRQPDGSLRDLPRKNIDTGAGLERIVPILQGVDSVWDCDVLRPIISRAEDLTGRRYGEDEEVDVKLRIMADHARSVSFLINDGVFPSNEDRGYVLRRILRRAALQTFFLGVDKDVLPTMIDAVADVMGEAWPELRKNQDFIRGVVEREEHRFRQTLAKGLALLDQALGEHPEELPGRVAFQLHDTYGFPIEVTREIVRERGASVDEAGFDAAMQEQQESSRRQAKSGDGDGDGQVALDVLRDLLDQFGPTEFTGYREYETTAHVVGVVGDSVFLDRSPFYAEGGGQIGDTGTITTSTGRARVLDTTYALPGIHRHVVVIEDGTIAVGQEATAAIDAERRDAIRRNHTGTHLLHWALREVLGSHVKQAGSYVGPDRLRFDFSHYEAVKPEELDRIEDLVNERILANEPVRAYETSKEEAERIGAIAFFGDKYGDVVRVLEAGTRSVELCGGTHVSATGMIGPVRVVSEGSIGSNLRRIEALTGTATLERMRDDEEVLERAAALLRVRPDELPERLEKEIEARRALEKELESLRRAAAGGEAKDMAGTAVDGVVVARRDGLAPNDLRDLALAIRDQGARAVVLGGVPDRGGVALVAAVAKDSGLHAGELIADAARTVGGGGGKQQDVAVAGGKDPSKLDSALDQARAAAGLAAA